MSLPEQYFDNFYAGKTDPWEFETRWYEQRKRAITLASLPRQKFAAGLEIGCSIGVLTAELSKRCEQLLAVDVAAAPLDIARHRLRENARVRFAKLTLPHEWPPGRFDLIVLSEVGYYWSKADLRLALDKIARSLTPDGIVVFCHWRHDVAEYPLTGDEVHQLVGDRADLIELSRHTEEDFILEVFSLPPGRSVATETGLV